MTNTASKRITLSTEILEWCEDALDKNLFPGVRSLSGLCEKGLWKLKNIEEHG